MRILHRIGTFCWMMFLVAATWAQSVDEIKADRIHYLWGEGKGNTLKKADSEALSDLINQVSTTVESHFTLLHEESQNADFSEICKSVVNTYSSATLSNTERIVLGDEPDAWVFRYIKRSEIDKIFESRKNKILEYAANAETAQENLQIADALRYYYWAHTLLRSHPDGASILYEDKNKRKRLLSTWIPLQINTLFSRLSVTIGRIQTEENYRIAELNIRYDGQAVRNFDYTYWDGRDWSNIISAKDGRGIVELPVLADTTHIRLKGEYVFDGEATVDAELRDVILKLDVVPFRSCYMEAGKAKAGKFDLPEAADGLQMEESRMNPELEAAVQTRMFFREVPDSLRYLQIMKRIEKAIRECRYEGIKDCFTPEGLDMFNRLIRYGQVHIIGEPVYYFVRCDSTVSCRNLLLSFRFSNNNRTFVEDVVFDFSPEAKVSSLSFGLSQAALTDIIGKSMWSEASRITLIRFLENYQTAYALKNLEYIESIFAEDALIIVGTVLKKQKVKDKQVVLDKQAVRYTQQTKEQYMKRLRLTFASNEFINLRFADNLIRKSSTEGELYGIQIRQDYFSTHYGDTGYLFLMVDLNCPEQPTIHVRAWQPEKDPDFGLVDLSHFTFSKDTNTTKKNL